MAQARFKIKKLVVVGVGLIGGSFARALKRAKAVRHVVGVGRSRKNLATALKMGLIDEAYSDPAKAVTDADLVLLATPVGAMADLMARMAPHLPVRAVITDGGSTKQDVVGHARRFLESHFRRFVPAHPIAGTEKSGAAAAFSDLYRGRNVIITPEPETERRAVRLVRAAWRSCGARVVRMRASEHDAVFAAVSHMPHVVAFALVNALARRPNAHRLFAFAGSGLRDTVRIAGSSPELWRDVCIANREHLLSAVDEFTDELDAVRMAIEANDGTALEGMFDRARVAHRRWLARE